MKKLMILGGSRYAIPVIKAAHELGAYVITCDYLPDNIAHKYSDEYCNVSIIDKDAVLEAAKSLGIDGITSFGCDPGVVTAAYVAEKLGLPSVGSYEAVSILQNKGKFRKFLSDNGFKVPTAKQYTSKEIALKETDIFHWPIIVKPTDSAGSKGVSKVSDVSALPKAIDHAIDNSISKEFIIEDFLEKKGCSSDSDCFSVNGKLKFVSYCAQRFDKKAANPYAPAAFSWPSTLSERHEKELTDELQRLITLLGLRSSIYNIETRECVDGNAYIMECSPRGGGNRLAEMIRYSTGVDLIKASVLAALGEDVSYIEQKDYNGHWAEVILHSEKDGAFEKLLIDDSIKNNIVEQDLWVKAGDHVGSFAAANESMGTLVMKFEDEARLLEVIDNVNDYIKVITK
ncbi:MAG: ATP-grasp domain-containing protein [Ruminococcus sp.]|nr:ATP-grasp domain-containing protein [Ruminococcus sp.]